jgi:hypothetical protein
MVGKSSIIRVQLSAFSNLLFMKKLLKLSCEQFYQVAPSNLRSLLPTVEEGVLCMHAPEYRASGRLLVFAN